jgi:hypothetical protein
MAQVSFVPSNNAKLLDADVNPQECEMTFPKLQSASTMACGALKCCRCSVIVCFRSSKVLTKFKSSSEIFIGNYILYTPNRFIKQKSPPPF